MNGWEQTPFKDALETVAGNFGLMPLTSLQLDQLAKHFEMLIRWNRRMNLTRITDPEQAARLHYAESLFGGRFIGRATKLLDIGAGAGFPSVPLAVLRPDIQITAIEANQKKSLFLNEVRDALALEKFSVTRKRFEDFDWSGYDLLTSRALDRAESVFLSVTKRLGPHQRLMLYCSPDLANALKQESGIEIRLEIQPVPRAESRSIALFSRS